MNVEFWLRVTARKVSYGHIQGPVEAFKKKPSANGNQVAINITMRLPDSLFTKPQLAAHITVPENQVSRPVITAEVCDNIAQALTEQLGLSVTVNAVEQDDGADQ